MQTDILVIGSGIGGATAALLLARDRQRQITLLTRSDIKTESNSFYAQGGIVSRGPGDSTEALVRDVLQAGAGLSYPPAVEILANEGPALVRDILEETVGISFDRDTNQQLVFGLEAAHSHRRILHVGDVTGQTIMQALIARILEQTNVHFLSSQTVVDLITFPHHARNPLAIYQPISCHGAYVFDQNCGEVYPILASKTILATGGLGQIYLNTTNPPGSRGDGFAMAYRAGVRVANSEYIQFHPTALSMPGTTKFLISEAVRGEGGILLTPKGDPFMEKYNPEWKDLAPRDIVARSIYWEMLENNYPHVLLDISQQKPADFIRNRFPKIFKTCLHYGVNITQQPIPVVPAAHYFCGGVLVDLWGRTSLDGLYAIGEVSCTGVHGANRLASTSLLEALVWGARVSNDIQKSTLTPPIAESSVPCWDTSSLNYDADPALIQGDMQTIRNLMWHYVGLVRSEYRLRRVIRNLRQLWSDIEEFYRKTRLTDGLIGLRNSIQNALVIAQAARSNRQSRGCHYRDDYVP